MLYRKTATRLAAALTLASCALLGNQTFAQAPAQLAPADTPVFMHMDQPSEWFGGLIQGPIGERMRERIETAEGSGDLLAALDMNFDQFMAAYFGGDVVIIGPGGNEPGIIFSEVSAGDRAHAIVSLGLTRQGEVAGNPLYIGPDGDGMIVMMDDWVAMCEIGASDYLYAVLGQADDAPRLADTERFERWTRELPAGRAMTMLVYEAEDNQHAMGMIREGRGLDMTYLGTSPDFQEMIGMLGETSVVDFGPLPAETIGAISFNLIANDDMRLQMQTLDPLLNGRSFVDDVLPKLDPQTLLFMGSVDGADLTPALDVQVPVVGMALRMNDDTAAQDLTTMVNGVVMFANFGVSALDAGMIPQRDASYNGSSYRVAELGTPVAQGLEYPELAAFQIVFGQIGDYYVLCSHEAFFKQCVDANAADQTMRMNIEGPPHRLAQTPILAMTGQPDGLGEVMISWINLFEQRGLPTLPSQDEEGDAEAEVQGIQNADMLLDVADLFRQYSLVKMQVWTGEDDLIIGRAQLTPPQ